jgi:lambda family phage portal protein
VKKASLNLIDKAIAFVNPKGAVDRLVARQKIKNFEYDAVKYSRQRKGPSSLAGAEDYRSNYDRVELMKRARDLAENVGLIRSILMKFASHTAANISYQARTENPVVNSEVEAYWAEWWDKCDISTRHTGSTLMQVAMMSMLRDGDFLFVLVRDSDGNLKIQGIEGDRLGDPYKVYTSSELIGGIHIDQRTGSPTAYDIYSRSIGDMYSFQTTIPSSQAFHLFDPLRIDQYRGISAFHTAINDATDIYDIVNFEKMAAKYASSQAGIIKRNNNNASDLSSLTNDQDINGSIIKLEAIESGKISYLEPGEDIVFPDGPSRPSGAFAEFHKILLRNICLGLGIPYSFAVDPSAMSGPTARLEMQQAGRTFRRYQKLLDDKVLRPIKNIVIADAVARGLIEENVGSRTTRGIFNFGANVSIDLGRESASAISEFKTGLRTAADIYAERGQDFESAMRQRAIEAKLIKDLAEKYGVAPETISDIVTPTPPQPQLPPAPAPKPVAPTKDEPEEGEDEGGDQKPIPEDPIDPSSEELQKEDREDELPIDESEVELPTQKKSKELEDCGTGAGGFKEGNTCSGGGAGGDSEKTTSKTSKSEKIVIAPEVLPGQKWGDNGQEFTEEGRAVRAKIGEFTITDAEGSLQKGAPGAVKRLGKKTREDLEKALSDPETVEAMRAAGINNIEVRGTSKTPAGFTYYGAHNKNNLIIHTKTSEAIAASKDEYRVKHGFNRLINHEIGHGIWDGSKEETRGNFAKAIRDNPSVIEEVAKRTRTQYSRSDVWDESKTDRTVTESFAELNGMKRFDKEGYSKLPQSVKDSIEAVEKEAKELRASLAKRGRIGPARKALESLDPASIKMLIEGMMGGIELAKYDGIDFTPPEGARKAAKRALDVRETKPSSQRGMTPVGIARARDLMNGVKFSPDSARRMKAFFDRHEVDKKGSTWDEQGKGWQAWNGWGGDAGYAWARKVVGQMEARDKKELAEPASCPIATQDIKTNLANRQTAVDDANYGPANPNEPNEDYWKAKADEFQGDIATAKKMLCGNCAAFDQRSKVLGCIKKGIGEDANEVAIGGDLGYCEIFDFKCAAKRTCDAWIVGGPITDKKQLARPVSQTPAPPKERIKGSKENPEGTASTRSKAGDIEISAENEEALKNKIAEFKDKHPTRKAPSLGALKKVFRRGAGAFSTSFRPTITGGKPNSRNAWAMARVNKFLKMAGGGEVKESYRKADGDLL